MSNMIRRASKETQMLKTKDFRIKDEDGNIVEPLLLDHFKRHIGDRFPTISDTIQQRLAEAMILRRRRILYRRQRQGNAAVQLQKITSKVSNILPGLEPIVPSAQANLPQQDNQNVTQAFPTFAPSQIKSATTLQPDKFKMAVSSPSVVSATVTIALGSHETLNFPVAPGTNAKRKYERLKEQRLKAYNDALNTLEEIRPNVDPSDVQTVDEDTLEKIGHKKLSAIARLSVQTSHKNILKSDLEAVGEITCPYCFYALPAEEVFDQRKWQ